MLRTLCLGMGLFIAAASAAGESAVQQAEPAPGARVRVVVVSVADRPLVGTIAASDARSISLRIQGRVEPLVIPREGITRFEVSVGRRSRAADALIGAIVGAAGGVALGAAAGSNKDAITREASLAAGGLLGALAGALIGAAITPGERWKETPVPGHPVTFLSSPGRGGSVAFALKF